MLSRAANSINRSIYWINGQLCFLQRYHKGSNKSGKAKYIARFIAPEHTRFCLLYLALIRPLQRMLAGACLGDEAASRYGHMLHIIGGKDVSGTKYSGILRGISISTCRSGSRTAGRLLPPA